MEDTKLIQVRYYWCVNCGHYADFGFERRRNIKCSKCKYEHITPLTQNDWNDYIDMKIKEDIENDRN